MLFTLAPAPAADFTMVTQGGKYLIGDDCINLRPLAAVPCASLAYTIPAGSTLTVYNLDNDAHSATADAVGPDGRPLFDGFVGSSNESAAVAGVSSLTPGTYPFHCVIHTMTGKLTVV
jgi:hypothetical protein